LEQGGTTCELEVASKGLEGDIATDVRLVEQMAVQSGEAPGGEVRPEHGQQHTHSSSHRVGVEQVIVTGRGNDFVVDTAVNLGEFTAVSSGSASSPPTAASTSRDPFRSRGQAVGCRVPCRTAAIPLFWW
jgi:hypothetical protein